MEIIFRGTADEIKKVLQIKEDGHLKIRLDGKPIDDKGRIRAKDI